MMYELDAKRRDLLTEAAPMAWEWSRTLCSSKPEGGMEEWAKANREPSGSEFTCDWYHGVWQFLRLLNMVAVPPWYEFYSKALGQVLQSKPDAQVLISAAADYGMLDTLWESVVESGTKPTIALYDICETPIRSSQWFAERHGFTIEGHRADLLRNDTVPTGAFDLIVTDEFMTVVKNPDKPMVAERWREYLKPGGVVVTTAMIGEPTTQERRDGYANRAWAALQENAHLFTNAGVDLDEMWQRMNVFAQRHTRHMLTGPEQVEELFAGYADVQFDVTPTPGECVNPTSSCQIVARKGG